MFLVVVVVMMIMMMHMMSAYTTTSSSNKIINRYMSKGWAVSIRSGASSFR